jgi:xanthine permease XanP
MGNIITIQKVHDLKWNKPDLENIGNGLLADGISVITAGLVGGMATDTSSSNVGASIATGTTSRVLAFTTGILLIFLAFSPKFSAIFSLMPTPVMEAILIFTICFMVITGLRITLSEKLTKKNIFIIGISLTFGLSVNMTPGLYESVPEAISPIFQSSLSLSAIVAIITNLILKPFKDAEIRL